MTLVKGDILGYVVRPMRLEDVRRANEIDRDCFPTQWPSPPYRRDLLFNRLAHYLVACEEGTNRTLEETEQKGSTLGRLFRRLRHPFRAEEAFASNRRVIGLVGLWIMAGEAHLTTIGVRQAYQRQGIGELLLISGIDLALIRNARVGTLEVRASNSTARALYEKYGFTVAGVRRGYYIDNQEDALIMTTDTITSASFQSQFQRLKQAHAERC